MVDKQLVINKDELNIIEEVITCRICNKLSLDPLQCNICDSVYCKSCLELECKMQLGCLNRCIDAEIKPSRLTRLLLSKLYFSCPYKCGEEINYDAYKTHINATCPSIDYKNKYFSLLEEYCLLQKEHDELMKKRDFALLPHQYRTKNHFHNLFPCITNRLAWRCNICTKTFKQKDVTYYCTFCDYDMCKDCKESGN